jgi:hypothetical protein
MIDFKRDVLPEPTSPIMQINSPRFASKSMLFKVRKSPTFFVLFSTEA